MVAITRTQRNKSTDLEQKPKYGLARDRACCLCIAMFYQRLIHA